MSKYSRVVTPESYARVPGVSKHPLPSKIGKERGPALSEVLQGVREGYDEENALDHLTDADTLS